MAMMGSMTMLFPFGLFYSSLRMLVLFRVHNPFWIDFVRMNSITAKRTRRFSVSRFILLVYTAVNRLQKKRIKYFISGSLQDTIKTIFFGRA